MDFDAIENFGIPTKYLSKEHELFEPNLQYSNAGVLPEIVRAFDPDHKDLYSNKVENKNVRKKIEENFPSGFDNVIFILADALGAQHVMEKGGLIANNMVTNGTVASTMFPSMTSTVMSSIAYGEYPCNHGLVGYNIFNEKLNKIWNSLNLQYLNDGTPKHVFDTLQLSDVIEGKPMIKIFEENNGQTPVSFIKPAELHSPSLLDIITPNRKMMDYHSVEEGVGMIMNVLGQNVNHQLTAFYYPHTDYAAHHFGPESDQYKQAIDGLEQVIGYVSKHPKVQNGSTLIVLTSDHGQVQIDHSISKWMTRDEWKEHKNKGNLLSSSGRVIHGYDLNNDPDATKTLLEEMSDEKGIVIDRKKAIELSGGSDKFANRFGDYLLIYEDNYMYDVPEIVQYGEDEGRLHGQHGSLTKKELYVPVGIFGKR